jgi:hypothetical protein
MVSRSPARWALGLCGVLFLMPTPSAFASSVKVSFETADGVSLEGMFYAGKSGKENATVLLLHDFDMKAGGSKDGLDPLALALQEKGYTVFTFDFRGFGNSTKVDPKAFWMFPHNKGTYFKAGTVKNPPSSSLSFSSFGPGYYPYLINDVLAARSYLDKRHDSGDVNTQNLIVIGAGHGATMGLMFLDEEWKRVRATPDIRGALFPPMVAPGTKQEGYDIVCGIWLGISPSIPGRGSLPMTGTSGWLHTVGKTNKTPMAFIYGKEDKLAAERTLAYLKQIIPSYERGKKPAKPDPDLAYTGEYAVPGGAKLKPQELLDKELGTIDWILKEYLDNLMEKRKVTTWDSRDFKRNTYVWMNGARPTLAKPADSPENIIKILPFSVVGVSQ